MELKVTIPYFECPENIRPFLQHIFDGEYEVPVNPIRPRILDIGANIGTFSIWASYRWPGSQVYAYEPDPLNFEILQSNLRRNSINSVHAMNWAIGNEGERMFYPGRRNCGEGGFYSDTSDIVSPISVTVKDPLSLPHANILKMDTEGCEVEILEALIRDGRKFDAVMFEFHRIQDRRILDNLLKDYILTGFELFEIPRGVVRYIHKDLTNFLL